MDIGTALEHLGYENITDFEISPDNPNVVAKWNHNDVVPLDAELQAAWDIRLAEILAEGPNLDDIKAEAKGLVDRMSEVTRLRYVTSGSSQAMTYQEKGDEAADYVANGYPADLSSYPFIQAEVNATGKTSTAAADDILAQKSAWIVVGAAVEEVRIGGKINIDAASNEEEVNSIRDAALAALEVI